jgi:hypothetical protein
MASGAPGPSSLNSSFANASRALSSKVSTQGFALRAEAASERTVTVRQNSQIDPSVLARIAIEEELKKKGGGGGGARSYNPVNWIPYSFKLLAKAIEEARTAVLNAFLEAVNSINQLIQGKVGEVGKNIGNLFKPLNNFIGNMVTSFAQNTAKALSEFAKNPLGFSIRMANNAALTGLAIFAAVVNGLKKAIYGKDEAINEADEENYKEKGIFSKLISFFTQQDENRKSNDKNIKSHLNNRAKSVTKRRKKREYITQDA